MRLNLWKVGHFLYNSFLNTNAIICIYLYKERSHVLPRLSVYFDAHLEIKIMTHLVDKFVLALTEEFYDLRQTSQGNTHMNR